MLATAEVRWFIAGDVPADIRRWFDDQRGYANASHEERDDWYLVIADCPHVGIKLRSGEQGNAELKIREGSEGEERFSDSSIGRIERWRKIAIADPTFADNDGPRDETSTWALVHKARSTHVYKDANAHIALELGIAQCRGEAWWTIGFESSSPDGRTVPALISVARQTLKNVRSGVLSSLHSYGYPEWLSRLRT